MKKYMILIVTLLLVILVSVRLFTSTDDKPFKEIEFSDVVSVTVSIPPSDSLIYITEMKELITLLKDIVIYNEDSSYEEQRGQAVIYSLMMVDGTENKIMILNPFVVINGVGYKTKYESCEKLDIFANKLLEETEE